MAAPDMTFDLTDGDPLDLRTPQATADYRLPNGNSIEVRLTDGGIMLHAYADDDRLVAETEISADHLFELLTNGTLLPF